jgi:hypothetical protein
VRGIDAEVDRIINVESDGALPEIEYLRWANTLFYTVQRQNKQGGYDQTLFCVAIATKKVIFKEIINRNQRALLFDSFFVYDRYLISIHDKTSVMVFVLQE